MSRTTLTGPLPDSFTTDSNLRVWYAINKDPVSGEQPGPGFTGSIPPSIVNSKGLAFVQLSNHQLTGGVPALPEGIRMFEAQSNALDGGIACECAGELQLASCAFCCRAHSRVFDSVQAACWSVPGVQQLLEFQARAAALY